MGAFQSGFQLGQGAWQQALDNKDRAGIRKRQDEEHAWKVEDRTRLAADRDNVDREIGSFQALQGGVYDGRQAKFNSPTTGGEMGPPMEPQMPNPSAGLTPRAPSALETNQGLTRLAAAQRDTGSLATLAKEAGSLRIDQKFGEALKAYKGDPEQIGTAIEYVNGNSKALTMSEPDKNGLVRMAIVTPDKKASFIKLSRQDQAQIFAAHSILQDDPARALAIMAGVNKTMAGAFAEENGLTKFMADNSNDVTTKGASMAADQARLTLERQRVGIAARAASDARRSAGRPQWVAMEDGKGGVRYVDMNAVPSVGGVAQLPEGTRPARKPVDQRAAVDMAKTLVESGMADPDAPGQPLTMEKAMALADARLSGQPYVSAQDRLLQQYIEAKNKGAEVPADPDTKKPAGRGLFTDKQGGTQLLEPFTRLNEFRKNMIANDNGNHGY